MSRPGNGCIALIAAAALTACTSAPLALTPPGRAPENNTVPTPTREVIIGVDRLLGGFNPHTLADLTPVSTAVAGLVLPSAFRQQPDGQWVLDDTLLISAEVTGTEPFTVTYRIRHDAQWSNTAPIAAEDFGYLAEQMRTQPGVVDSAGYQLIDQVESRDGGKTVEVVFRRPYAGWRTLFRQLLPAHLLKDAPGGWSQALDEGLGVSGGPFTLSSLDSARGELLLVRNDRYWDTPAQVDRILLREGSDAAVVDALRTGGAQAALFGYPDAITELLLGEANVPVTATVVPQPIVASILLRPAGTVLDDQRMRVAVAGMLDRPGLIATGTASGPSTALRADSQVLAPSQPTYRPSAPASGPAVAPEPDTTHRLLTEAGYTRGPSGWERAGQPLRLVVAAPADREPYGVLATRVAAALQAAGIGVDLRLIPPAELFDTLAPTATGADIVVVPRPTAGDPATQLASWHGCPLVVPARLTAAPPNPAGLCDLSLQPLIEQALTLEESTGAPAPAVDPAVEAGLWELVVTVPLYQQAWLWVTTPALEDAAPGAPLEGPLDAAQHWRLRR
ncbi:MAG: ABC transporter family substrate-binding protein [Pseudonocardiaceae bacterium]